MAAGAGATCCCSRCRTRATSTRYSAWPASSTPRASPSPSSTRSSTPPTPRATRSTASSPSSPSPTTATASCPAPAQAKASTAWCPTSSRSTPPPSPPSSTACGPCSTSTPGTPCPASSSTATCCPWCRSSPASRSPPSSSAPAARLLPRLPFAHLQRLPPTPRVEVGHGGGGERVAAVQGAGPDAAGETRADTGATGPERGSRGRVRGAHPQHVRRAGGPGVDQAPARRGLRPGVRRRPAPHAFPIRGGLQQPAPRRRDLTGLAGRAPAGVRAVRELREPGVHDRAGARGDGVGHRRERRRVPLGRPPRHGRR